MRRSKSLPAYAFATILGTVLTGLLSTTALAATVLMPQPRSVSTNHGERALTAAFVVVERGCKDPALDRAVSRFQADVVRLAGIDLTRGQGPVLEIVCETPSMGGPARLEATEAYGLTIGADGVRLTADGPAGILRGLATLRQLIGVSGTRVTLPFVSIDDAPRFAWRGLMIDTARHFVSLPTLKRQIDAMELVKLNVLHLHLSDNEGFRVESKRYPKLQALASNGQYYTQDEIRDLVAYAADRGVRIVPEFDVPGHTRALLKAYPELAAKALDPTNPTMSLDAALNPASADTYRFLEGLFGEMSALFPDRYFHLGGDEVSVGAWKGVPEIDAFMRKEGLTSKLEAEAFFHKKMRAIIRRLGKLPIGWEEVNDLPVDDEVVVQAWRTSNAVARATSEGHKVIVSAGYYLDFMMPADYHYGIDPVDPNASGLTAEEVDRARQASAMMAYFLVDGFVLKPRPSLTAEQEELVLGGEAPLWAELLTDEMVDARLWPRAAAVAERLWSPASVKDPADMFQRLAVVQDELRVLGLQDLANRERMIARMAPGESGAISVFLDTVGPVRNLAHNHSMRSALQGKPRGPAQEFVGLVDAAPADSLIARRFTADARRIADGDRDCVEAVEAQLTAWRSNHARFVQVARGRPMLEAAVPVSADVAELASVALEALEALKSERRLSPQAAARSEALLARVEAAENASSRPILSSLQPQPPADLIISITPGVRSLIDAAR